MRPGWRGEEMRGRSPRESGSGAEAGETIEVAGPAKEFVGGVRAELPLLPGVIPFGMIYGVLALGAGIPPGLAFAMSSIVFAGSSQFAATQLIGAGASAVVVIATTSILNLRHSLYSSSLAPYLRSFSPPWKWLLGYLLTDEAYAVTIARYRRRERVDSPDHAHWYFLGAGVALWVSWQLSTAAGVFLGAQVPRTWSLDFTLPLTFIGLGVPTLRDRPILIAALCGGGTAVALAGLPYRLGLMVGAMAGILAGLWAERRQAHAGKSG
jgi:4-azaleucine resistance transporter AzlC